MRSFRFIALLICLSLLLGCSTIQTDIESSAQPESAAASPPTSSVSEQELVPEEETLSSVADLSEGNEPPAEKALAQYVVSLDDIETNKWIYAIELIPGYQYDDPEQEPYELVIDVGDYQLGWSLVYANIITVYGKNDKILLDFEDIRPVTYLPAFPTETIKFLNSFDTEMSVFYTGSKLYFIYMAEMSGAKQTYQIYQWDLEAREMQFVSQYPDYGYLEVLEIENNQMILFLAPSLHAGHLISKIDLTTGEEIGHWEGEDAKAFLHEWRGS